MGEAPAEMSLDRIDVNGDYCKANCRWASSKQQSRNKRNNVRLEFLGETLAVSEWAERLGLNDTTIHERLKRGWTVEQALNRRPGEKP
jgi:hypothetical protein